MEMRQAGPFPGLDHPDLLPVGEAQVGPVHLSTGVSVLQSVGYIALGNRTRPEAWDNWLRVHPDMPRPRSIRMLDHHFLMIEAALGGLGVAMAPFVLVRDEVARRRLVAPVGFAPGGTEYGLIAPLADKEPARVQSLRDWLATQAIADQMV